MHIIVITNLNFIIFKLVNFLLINQFVILHKQITKIGKST